MFGLFAFISGIVFAGGLILGGMTQPAKVVNFLDVGGHWDASLMFVLGGAVVSYFFLYRYILTLPKPLAAEKFAPAICGRIDRRLIIGGIFFGAGWGLAGYCPGPALVSLGTGSADIIIFVLAMFGGFALQEVFKTLVDRERMS